ncbi:hypothetical protein [Bacteriophage sp.]|nr:hypothetical protein [Bacteriophage sp.]
MGHTSFKTHEQAMAWRVQNERCEADAKITACENQLGGSSWDVTVGGVTVRAVLGVPAVEKKVDKAQDLAAAYKQDLSMKRLVDMDIGSLEAAVAGAADVGDWQQVPKRRVGEPIAQYWKRCEKLCRPNPLYEKLVGACESLKAPKAVQELVKQAFKENYGHGYAAAVPPVSMVRDSDQAGLATFAKQLAERMETLDPGFQIPAPHRANPGLMVLAEQTRVGGARWGTSGDF